MFRLRWKLFLAPLLSLALPAVGLAATEEALVPANHVPWSGWWWPMKHGGLQGPLGKYDHATGKNAKAWEVTNNPQEGAKDWYGFCHAWAASAITEPEPKEGKGEFTTGDFKGLLAALHTADLSNSYGERFESAPPNDPQDLYPDQLWHVLRLYIKQQGLPLVRPAPGARHRSGPRGLEPPRLRLSRRIRAGRRAQGAGDHLDLVGR
jgi:hypothetical protein